MRIPNIYADERGEGHFRDIEVEWAKEGPDGTTSKRFPATGVIFHFTLGTWHFDWHTATRRQYVIDLDGPNQITASDGETRVIGVGEVILIEDVHGKGHLSRAAEGEFRHSILIPVEQQYAAIGFTLAGLRTRPGAAPGSGCRSTGRQVRRSAGVERDWQRRDLGRRRPASRVAVTVGDLRRRHGAAGALRHQVECEVALPGQRRNK